MLAGARPARGLFTPLLAGLVAFAWLHLTLWSLSPYARYLNHDVLEHLPLSFTGRYFVLLLLFLLGWVLMTVAMMLPTTLPLVRLFRRVVSVRGDGRRLLGLLLFGYLITWSAFGVVAHFGDLLVHAAVHHLGWLASNEWIIGASTLLVASAYQFSPIKYRCLDECRSPHSFLAQHWRGGNALRQALRLGVRHGIFCIGCCWHLMLLMFAFACGNVGWMLVLGSIMAVEKNLPWGKRISLPLGVTMLGGSVTIALASVL